MTNTHIEASRNLLANCSIETTPNVYAKYGKFSDLVDKESNIYVTFIVAKIKTTGNRVATELQASCKRVATAFTNFRTQVHTKHRAPGQSAL